MDPISRDLQRIFGKAIIPESAPGTVFTVTKGAQSTAPLYEGIRMSIPDELKAVGEYRAMAQLARQLAAAVAPDAPGNPSGKYTQWATTLDGIADQEQEHHRKLSEMFSFYRSHGP